MYGLNPFQPYWWMANPLAVGGTNRGYPTIDRTIPWLCTNAIQVTEESVDFGINPCYYNRLPNESIILLKIRNTVPASAANLPVTVVTPSSGGSTVNNPSSSGTTKIPVVDHNNTPVSGANIVNPTERLAYLNKCTGTLRFLEFTNTATPAAENASAAAVNVKSAK